MKVAIVEDERLEREAIKLLLERSGLTVEVVFEAINGEDAVSLFRIHRPHLIFMDIQLPLRSGLNATEEILRLEPDTTVVILTAHNDFSYAQQAVKLQVLDYLLKPYNDEAFYSVLYRAQKRLEQKKERDSKDSSIQKFLREMNNYMNRDLLQYMMTGRAEDEWSLEFLVEYFEVHFHELRCILLKDDSGVYDEKAAAQLEKKLQCRFPQLICRVLDKEVACLLLGKQEQVPTAEFIQSHLQNVTGRQWKLYMSGPIRELSHLPDEYRRLKDETGIAPPDARVRSQVVIDMFSLESDLFKSTLRMDWQECRQILTKLAHISHNDDCKMRNRSRHSVHYFSYLWRQNDRYIFQMTGRRKTLPIKFTIDEMLEKTSSPEEMVDVMTHFLQSYLEALELDKQTTPHKAIGLIKEYIDENLAGNLSLDTVAEIFGFSSYYLSRLFKKVENESYKNYIIRVRMEKAKALLSKGDLSIAQVARMVGYTNTNYFSNAFKQYSGLSAKSLLR